MSTIAAVSRRSYLRYASRNEALAGILQALLMTKHMLFVGFGMQDANFSRIVDAVQRAREPHAAPSHETRDGVGRDSHAVAPRLGHALFLQRWDALESLWEGEVEFVPFDMEDDADSAFGQDEADRKRCALVSARRLEIFLDRLVMLTAGARHLLKERHKKALDEFEEQLAERVRAIADFIAADSTSRARPSAQPAIAMLEAYGWAIEPSEQ